VAYFLGTRKRISLFNPPAPVVHTWLYFDAEVLVLTSPVVLGTLFCWLGLTLNPKPVRDM